MIEKERLDATVEELKEKIEDINQDVALVIEHVEQEEKEKIKNIKDEAVEAIEKCIEFIKYHYEEIKDNEELQKLLITTKDKTVLVYSEAKEKIKEFVKSPKVNEKFDQAKEAFTDLSNKTIDKVKEGVESLKENEDLMNSLNVVKDEASKGVKNVKNAINDFAARPDVQDKIESAKEMTIDVAEKTVDVLKAWLKPKGDKTGKEDSNGSDSPKDQPKE